MNRQTEAPPQDEHQTQPEQSQPQTQDQPQIPQAEPNNNTSTYANHNIPRNSNENVQRQSLITSLGLLVPSKFGTSTSSQTTTVLAGATADLMLRLTLMRDHDIILGCSAMDSKLAMRAVSAIAPELTANKLTKRDHSHQYAIITALQKQLVGETAMWLFNHRYQVNYLEINEQLEFLARTRANGCNPSLVKSLTNTWVQCRTRSTQDDPPQSERNPPAPPWQAATATLAAKEAAETANDCKLNLPADVLYPPELKLHLRFSANGTGITSNVSDFIRSEAIKSSTRHQLAK
jgi:hypothetical protein